MERWTVSLRALPDLFLPKVCTVCGCELGLQEDPVCRKCLEDLPRTFYWLREYNPMSDKLNALVADGLSSETENHVPVPYSRAAALFFYNPESGYSRITKALKYHRYFAAGHFFAAIFGEYLESSALFRDVDMVIPVPLHWTRRWKRGYNQAEEIARELSKALKAPMETKLLRRTRRTAQQARLSHSDRSDNIRDAFSADPLRLKESAAEHVLLVDDVFTTGTTVYECLKALRRVLPPESRISVAALGYSAQM